MPWTTRKAQRAVLLLSAIWASPGVSAEVLDLDGRVVDPWREDRRATVLLFARTDCPISNRYAPEVRRIYETFRSRGIDFWLVYADADATTQQIRQHIADYDYPITVLRDPTHELVARSGAKVTPEAAVFVGTELVYRGRIDNRYVAFGKQRPAPTRRDLVLTLQAIVDGNVPELSTTEAVGCFISPLDTP